MPSKPQPRAPARAHGSCKTRGCLIQQVIGHGPQQHHHTIAAKKSDLGEGRAGAISMSGRIGGKIAARTTCYGRQAAGTRRYKAIDIAYSLDQESLCIASWPG
eukprot:357940-Chlamydomonas_euryale.AAC.2